MPSYTHFYDFLRKFIMLMVAALAVGLVVELLPPMGLLAPLFCGLVLVAVIYLLHKTLLPEWLSTFLYIRLTLRTKVSQSEAKRLSFLFDGSLDGKWHPLFWIRKVNQESRKEAIFEFAQIVATEIANRAK